MRVILSVATFIVQVIFHIAHTDLSQNMPTVTTIYGTSPKTYSHIDLSQNICSLPSMGPMLKHISHIDLSHMTWLPVYF